MERIEFKTEAELQEEIKKLKAKGWTVGDKPHVAPKHEKIICYYAFKEAKDEEKVEGAALGQRDIMLVCPIKPAETIK